MLFSRKVVLVTCLFSSAVLIGFAGLVATTAGAVTLVALSVFFLYLTGAIYWAVIQDVVDQTMSVLLAASCISSPTRQELSARL